MNVYFWQYGNQILNKEVSYTIHVSKQYVLLKIKYILKLFENMDSNIIEN